VDVLRGAWSHDPVAGSEGSARVYVTPAPGRDGGPPIWLGGESEPAARRAGRIADGFMATDVSPDAFAEQVGWARDERRRSGQDPASLDVSVWMPTYIWAGPIEEAWERIGPLRQYLDWKYDDMGAARARSGPPKAPRQPPSPEEQAALRARMVIGDPEHVIEQVRGFQAVADGDLHFVAGLYWPGMPPADRIELMERLAADALPLLR
jgi:alkanesulfonate monooxygenase SsuD/methylene tetrahydromethanopterin reductase-like flavin-dependent oxidoreductase (luciferase family)